MYKVTFGAARRVPVKSTDPAGIGIGIGVAFGIAIANGLNSWPNLEFVLNHKAKATAMPNAAAIPIPIPKPRRDFAGTVGRPGGCLDSAPAVGLCCRGAMYKPPGYTIPALLLPGLALGTAIRLRNALYSAGLLRSRKLNAPVVSVGNITLGGSGKTPLVIHLARMLEETGHTPALLTRGYGRAGDRVHVLPPGNEIPNPALNLGDEPALIRRRVPGAWVAVGADRYAAGLQVLQRRTRPVFLLDDGFQHRRLSRDVDIVVVDATQPLRHNRVFPLGSLREPLRGLRRAHAVVLNGGARGEATAEMEQHLQRLTPALLLRCSQFIRSVVPIREWLKGQADAAAAPPAKVFAVSGIGNPTRFHADLAEAGFAVAGTRTYRDHYRMRPADWQLCAEEACRAGAGGLVVTEKDAIKLTCAPEVPLWVAVQQTRVEREEQLRAILVSAVKERP